MRNILDRLRGGDLRSTGVANDVALEVIEDPSLIPILFKGMAAGELVVRMLATQRPQCLGHAQKLLRELSTSGTPAMRSRGVKLLRMLAGPTPLSSGPPMAEHAGALRKGR
jgi:hypothetical protein